LRSILIAGIFVLIGFGQPGGPPALPSSLQNSEASVAAVPAMPLPDAGYRLPEGQSLTYGAEWRVFNAGTVTLRMERAGQEERAVGTANAVGSVAVLYHVHDIFESFFDPSTFCSRNLNKHAEEGLRQVDSNVTFDYQRGKAVLDQKNLKKNDSRHEEHDVPPCVSDVLSAIYYAGSLAPQPGKTYHFPLNDGGNTMTVDLYAEARELVTTPAGMFYAIRVHPETATGLLKDKGNIRIWYSDDAAHIPVQMRGHMAWGTLRLTLQRMERK
jgi:hypothetical protein